MINKTNFRWVLLLLIFMLSVPPELFAQAVTIKGKVVDTSGEAIIGASVLEKNSKRNGTTTDLNGDFSLKVSASGKRLVISYIGMKPQEVTAVEGKVIKITMEDDQTALNEVVVIGYGSKVRADLTGSVGSVSGASLARVPVASAAEALQGKIAGVQVTTLDGEPGAEINIRVRGGTSVTQSNQPLYIVDGFQASNINDIPPTDIQSIDVLKDASLTAVYGAKGGNGVIIVTTKSAQEGKISVNFNTYAQVRSLVRKLDLLDPYDYVKLQYDNVVGDNTKNYKFRDNFGHPLDFDLYKNVQGIDWQDEILGGHPMSYMYNVTVGGGSEKLKFNTSLTHNDENGVLIGSGVRRTNLNMKFNAQLSPKVQLLVNSRISYRRTAGAGADNVGNGGIIDILRYRPTNGLRDFANRAPETVDPEEEKFFQLTNPKGQIDQNYNLQHSYTFTNQVSLEWTIMKGLQFRTEGMLSMGFSNQDRFWGYLTSGAFDKQPVADKNNNRSDSYIWTNTLSYGLTLNKQHNLSFLLGQEVQHSQSRGSDFNVRYLPKEISPTKALNNMGLGTPYSSTSYISSPDRTASFFGQANYNFDRKYLVSTTFRADGSTKFAPGNQWGYFPAISGAWVVKKEKFMEGLNFISNLKIRAAVGMAGNNRITDDMWRYQYVINSSGGPGWGEKNEKGYDYYVNAGGSTFPNTKIKWETTMTRNLAIDLGLFGERLTITPEIYWNTTRDLLYESEIPLTTGYTRQMQNIGQVTNRGFELTINATIVDNRDFKLNGNFTFGSNKTRIDKLNGVDDVIWATSSRWKSSDYDYCLKVGDQLGLIYGYVSDGLYGFDEFNKTNNYNYEAKEGTVNCNALFGTAPGKLKFKNFVDGVDGVQDVNIVNDNDKVVIGNTNPKFSGGFGLNGSWKNFDFSCNFAYMYGFDVNNATRYTLSSFEGNSNNYYNVLAEFAEPNRWRYANDQGDRMLNTNWCVDEYIDINSKAKTFSPVDIGKKVAIDKFIEDGSFLRLQDVTIGYTLPKKMSKRMGIERLRFYTSGYNLFLWTKYSGYDPEVDVQTGLTPGVDYNRYPRSRNFLLGLNITF